MYEETEFPRRIKIKFPTQWEIEFPTLQVIISLIKHTIRGLSMIQKTMFKKIKRYKHKGYSKKSTSLELKIDRKTVRKYWDMSDKEYLSYLQSQLYRNKAFDIFKSEILKVYALNDNNKLQMSAVYDFLEEKFENLPASEQSLRNYIHYLMETNQLELEEKIRTYTQVPELPYGQQLQIDFGEYTTKSNLKLYIFAAVLSASRYKYIALQEKPFTTMCLITHLLDCFDYFEGMPKELVIDQDSVMVVSENYGDILFTRDFTIFKDEMDLKIYTCRKADPESKGKIENCIKFFKNNFLSIRDFEYLDEASESLSKWLIRRGNGKISQATRKIPAQVFEEEKHHLRPIRNSIYRKNSLISRDERSVDDKSYISYNGSHYSVPTKYRNKHIDIYATNESLFVFDQNTGNQLAKHKISKLPGKRIKILEHFREKSTKLADLKEEIANLFEVEGWKEFIEKNVKAFPRYVRDQCILAKRFFNKKSDPQLLKSAISFCLENKTYSFINLWDTYIYYQHSPTKTEKLLPACLPTISAKKQTVAVAERDLEIYRAIIEQEDEVVK